MYIANCHCPTSDFNRLAILDKMLTVAKEKGARMPEYDPVVLCDEDSLSTLRQIPGWLKSSGKLFARPDILHIEHMETTMASYETFRKHIEEIIPRYEAMKNHMSRTVHLPHIKHWVELSEDESIHPYSCTVEFIYEHLYYRFTSSHYDSLYGLTCGHPHIQADFQPKDLQIPDYCRSLFRARISRFDNPGVYLAPPAYIDFDADSEFTWDLTDIKLDPDLSLDEIGKLAAEDRENMYLTAAHRLFNRLISQDDTTTFQELSF